MLTILFTGCSDGGEEDGGTGASSGSSSSSASSSTSSSSSSGGISLSDEFSADGIDLLADNTSDWQVLHPEMADAIDIGITVDDALTVFAQSTEPAAVNAAWFQNNFGTLVYKEVTGNFAVLTRLRVVDRNNATVTDPEDTAAHRPGGDYNAGGFVIRDPAGTHTNDENWVMYNMGGQGVGYAREMKKTLNSISNMFITLQTTVDEFLLACRVGDTFYFYHWDQIDNQWRQETFHNDVDVHGDQVTTDVPNGMAVITEFSTPNMGESTPMFFELDLPDTVQVGVMSHAWTGPYETRAEFDYVRFADNAPTTQNECETSFPEPM
jgi:hypothetical protein